MALGQLNFAGLDRVEVALARLREFEPSGGYNLAFSGGKDSVVILDLAKQAQVKFRAIYSWTGIDPPELYRFVKANYPDVEIRKPEKTMWTLIQEHHILPLRNMRFCCEDLKEDTFHSGIVVTGVRWEESTRRRKRRMIEVCMKNKAKTYLHPIIDWTTNEVWEYIQANQVPYCSLYDEGFKRLGCILCPFSEGESLRREMARWPKHVQMWKLACDRLVTAGHRGYFKTGQEMFDWWIKRKRHGDKENCQLAFM